MKLSDYLTDQKDGSVKVTRDTEIIVRIPRAYEKYKRLNVTDQVDTLAIFEVEISGERRGFFCPASVIMCPSLVEYVTEEGQDYLKATFSYGDTFIKQKRVVKNEHIAYIVFTEFVEKGQIPRYMKYEDLAYLFDTVVRITGCELPAEHATFEMIYSYLSRSKNNVRIPYRLTTMEESPLFLKLKDVPHAASSTTAKLIGSYLNDSIATSMVNASEDSSDIEDLLRR